VVQVTTRLCRRRNVFLQVASRKKGRKIECQRATSKRSTRFAVEFFVVRVAQVRKEKDFFCRWATYKGKYGKAKEAVESARAGLSPQAGDVRKSRKEKDQGRQEGGSSEGKVPCALNQEFPHFWFTSIWVWKRPVLVEVSAPTRLGLQGSNVRKKFQKRTTLRSESSTLKGLLYAPIQRRQYHKRTTLRRLKILLQSNVARKVRTIAWANCERESCHLTSDNQPLFTSWKFLSWFHTWAIA
jgi:hypothetical protein